MKTICVADIKINIISGDKDFFDVRLKDYEIENTDSPDMVLETYFLDDIPEPEGEVLEAIKATKILKSENGMFARYLKLSKSGVIPYSVYYTEDYSHVKLYIKNNYTYRNLSPTEWEYLYTGFLFANRLTYMGGTVLHSSSLSYKDVGIAFSADPGTGKSTHVSLWKKKFGDEVTIVNDDKPAIRFIDDKAYLYGTPWSGKTDLNINIKKPLKAIVFLERGEINSIETMSITDSVLNLLKQLPNPFYDKEIGIKTVDFIKKIYDNKIPVYRLKCTISEEAVDVVYNEIVK